MFMTRKWIKINDLSGGQYSVNKNIKFRTSMLRSDLCDYSDAYIVVKGRITVAATLDANEKTKNLTFKNNSPFMSCISKINNTFIDSAEDIDVDMPMYKLLEYSDNYSMTLASQWNYCSDEVNNDGNENNDACNYRINNHKIPTSKSFEYKTEIVASTAGDNNTLNTEVVVPLKYLSNFWRSYDLP